MKYVHGPKVKFLILGYKSHNPNLIPNLIILGFSIQIALMERRKGRYVDEGVAF